MPDTAIFKYVQATGAAGLVPGADANTYTLFSSVLAFQGARMAPQMGYKRLMVDIKNANAGTLKLYKSPDRGVNWYQINEQAVGAAAANATNPYDFLIEEYDDFKLDWVNGGASQAAMWQVSISLSDSRNPMS